MSIALSSFNSLLSDEHKEEVKRWIVKLRNVLEDDFEAQVMRLGFRRNGKDADESKLSLPEADMATRRRLSALIEHDTKGEGTPHRGFDAVVRELTYTLVNRLVGLKVMEARGLLYLPEPGADNACPEATEVLTLVPGQDRSRFLRDFRAAGGRRYKYDAHAEEALLRDGLTAAFTGLHADLGPLFNPEHDYACVWPSHAALTNAIRLINEGLPPEAYPAPDFFGWVYQFFNREEKVKVRAENKGTPRSSYELSVINQFYTPSWVVKVLVDNTLGRLWIQMHPDSTLLSTEPAPLPRPKDYPVVADYLIPRTGERIPFRRLEFGGLVSQFKRVRDIRLLDPACGTLHFGQYAFGLLYRMYEEEIENVGKEGWPDEPSVPDRIAIPSAILDHNLHGIDIDPRAIQIASLSVLFTAKDWAVHAGGKPTDVTVRPRNLIVAQAVQIDPTQLHALVNQAGEGVASKEVREKLFRALWTNLQYVGELGSLIQVQEGVNGILVEWVDAQAKARGLNRMILAKESSQLELGAIDAEARRSTTEKMELLRSVIEEGAARIRDELISGLDRVATQVRDDPRQRLFVEDTAQGLRLIKMLSLSFDVIVMNPPYGSFAKIDHPPQEEKSLKENIKAMYPCGYQDIYAAFVERATQLIEREGYIGALISSTFKTNVNHAKFRTELLLKRNPLVSMLDIGFGILDDATVEAAAIVMRGGAL